MIAGCIVVPTSYVQPGSRRNVSEETLAELEPDVTTLEEVMLRLGEPDFVSEDGRRLGYQSTKVRALVIVSGYESGDVAETSKESVLELTFDGQDLLAASTIVSKWGTEDL